MTFIDQQMLESERVGETMGNETLPALPDLTPRFDAPIGSPISTLLEILSLRRPHGGEGEIKLAEKYLLPLNPTIWSGHQTPRYISSYSSNVKPLGDPADPPIVAAYTIRVDDTPVLWSCHIDTVHCVTDPVDQEVLFDAETGLVWKDDKTPLGADDGAAVWLFLQMIEAKVPGTYIFHRGEERGGIGSRIMAREHQDFLKKFTHAIAVDRRKTCSVITHQSRGRCCSDKFAEHFAAMLSDENFKLAPDSTGVYTDTAEYTGLIGECTNISAGYESEHTAAEILDLEYLQWLRDKLLSMDINALLSVQDRKAGDPDPDDDWKWQGYGYGGWADYDAWRYPKSGNTSTAKPSPVLPPLTYKSKIDTSSFKREPSIDALSYDSDAADVLEYRTLQIEKWVQSENPWVVAELIKNLAYEAVDRGDLVYELEKENEDQRAENTALIAELLEMQTRSNKENKE